MLTEVVRVDPSFDKDEFARFCETDIIPNVLEAINKCDLDILRGWLHERAFKVLEQPLQERMRMGYTMDAKILDISRVEVRSRAQRVLTCMLTHSLFCAGSDRQNDRVRAVAGN